MNGTDTTLPDFLKTGTAGRLAGRRRWLVLGLVLIVVVAVVALFPASGSQQGQ